MPTVRELLAEATRILERAGVDDADREATWLLAHVLETSAGALRIIGHPAVTSERSAHFRQLVARREAREPIQYILGTEEFLGMSFRVSPAVLIPRLDTETLVRSAIAQLNVGARVADVGTGSGAIAIGVAAMMPDAVVVATDISRAALEVARENAKANGVAARITFRQGDLLAPLAGDVFDAVLSNPPYIGQDEVAGLMPEVRDWEPVLALTPGPDGLAMYRRLAAGAPGVLKPGGLLGVEVGAGQAPAVSLLFERAGFVDLTVACDTAGVERAVVGKLP